MNFNKIIIWGHKLHSHTHSYIHNAFYLAFKHLGYNVLWLDDNDNIENIDFENVLFLTEHQVCKNIPIKFDCKYILHNSFIDPGKTYYKTNAGTWRKKDIKFKKLAENGNIINIQVYKTKFVENKTKLEDYVYYDLNTFTLYFPWATDLLPDQINKIKKNIRNNSPRHIGLPDIGLPDIGLPDKSKIEYLVGTIVDEWKPFQIACIKNKINFVHMGGYNGLKKVSIKENISLIQKSYIAPAIQRKSQCQEGYIPCRIFKNISYGKMGFTNSLVVYELFNKKIIYNPCTTGLFYDASFWIENKYDIKKIHEVMDFVRDKHTYLNRIDNLFTFFEIITRKIPFK